MDWGYVTNSGLTKFKDCLLSLNRVNRNILILGSSIAGLYLAAQSFRSYKKSQLRKKWASFGKDVVIVHHLGRGINTPSISPFPIKLETYLRITGIHYEVDFEEPMGKKGKMPWITLNNEEFTDSSLIMELLSRKFQKDLSSHLTEEEKAVARAFQIMAEEHLYWVGLLRRWVYTKGRTLPDIQSGLPYVVRWMMPLISRRLLKSAIGQGIGRHTEAEVYEMGIKDLKAISIHLGDKPFFTGDKATEVDCSIFGILCQTLWNPNGSPVEQGLHGEFSNLKAFCERMKEQFWPDWNRCLNPPRIA